MKTVDPSDYSSIRCICASTEDDGFTIQCELCFAWQHASCVNITKASIPDEFYCEGCILSHPESVPSSVRTGRSSYLKARNNYYNPNNGNNSNSVGRRSKAFKRGSIKSLSALADVDCSEISENIYSPESCNILKNRLLSHILAISSKDGVVEWKGGKEVLNALEYNIFGNKDELLNGIKAQLREISTKQLQRYITKKGVRLYGLFADCELGVSDYISEFVGLISPKEGFNPYQPTEGKAIHWDKHFDIVVDARHFSNLSRQVRRSCRPNAEIRLTFIRDNFNSDLKVENVVKWALYATKVIFPNEEILLPFDYEDGNTFYKHECACNSPDFCLAPSPGSEQNNSVVPQISYNVNMGIAKMFNDEFKKKYYSNKTKGAQRSESPKLWIKQRDSVSPVFIEPEDPVEVSVAAIEESLFKAIEQPAVEQSDNIESIPSSPDKDQLPMLPVKTRLSLSDYLQKKRQSSSDPPTPKLMKTIE